MNPGILPVSSFDPSFGPVVSLGREIMGIDNLFISPTGRLTLVEAKLWRNPQAVREVLAQVVDYASRLSELTYEDFEERCRASRQTPITNGFGLFDLVCREFPDHNIQQTEFVDGVTRNLRNGRFLLLVVGDGIREGLERMLDALHHQSRLHFTFGLVELQLFRLPRRNRTACRAVDRGAFDRDRTGRRHDSRRRLGRCAGRSAIGSAEKSAEADRDRVSPKHEVARSPAVCRARLRMGS